MMMKGTKFVESGKKGSRSVWRDLPPVRRDLNQQSKVKGTGGEGGGGDRPKVQEKNVQTIILKRICTSGEGGGKSLGEWKNCPSGAGSGSLSSERLWTSVVHGGKGRTK